MRRLALHPQSLSILKATQPICEGLFIDVTGGKPCHHSHANHGLWPHAHPIQTQKCKRSHKGCTLVSVNEGMCLSNAVNVGRGKVENISLSI